MRKIVSQLFLVCIFLLAGCGGPGKNLLSRHPLRETRMATAAREGYVATGVWKIHGAQNTVYLAGTSHLVPESQIPFPSTFYAAYQDSQEIYVEYNTHSVFATMRMLPKAVRWIVRHRHEFISPRGRDLNSYLEKETVAQLEEYYGKEYRKKKNWTPLFLLFMSDFETMTQEGAATSGVEDVFMHAASRDRKPIRPLDDKKVIDTAFLALDEMLTEINREVAKKGVDAVIQERILSPKKDELDDNIWRHGDLEAVLKLTAEMKEESPAFYQEGLVERNQKWLPRIKGALTEPKNIMILVGVAHLAGKEGLLEMLRAEGFKPDQLFGVERPATP